MEKKAQQKIFKSSIFFLVLVLITFFVFFKNTNIDDIIKIIDQVNIKYILIAILCMATFSLCECINIRRALITLGDKPSFFRCLKYAIVGFFFSSITPASSGGQPMQLYFMQKDGLPIAHSTLALLVELSSFQFITLFLSLTCCIFFNNLVNQAIGNIKYLFIIGIIINIFILFFLLMIMFSKKLITKTINIIEKILKIFKYSKIEEFHSKMGKHIEEYKRSGEFLLNNKAILIKTNITTLVQFVLYYSIPYFVYLSFNLNSHYILEFIAIQAILYTAVSYLPFPGMVGISEGTFMLMFKILFPENILSSAMLLSRGISFYLFVFLTGIIIMIISFKMNKNKV